MVFRRSLIFLTLLYIIKINIFVHTAQIYSIQSARSIAHIIAMFITITITITIVRVSVWGIFVFVDTPLDTSATIHIAIIILPIARMATTLNVADYGFEFSTQLL